MIKEAYDAFEDVDVILYIIEATDKKIGPGDSMIIGELKKASAPVILLINKIDLIEKTALLPLIAMYSEQHDFEEIIPISAIDAGAKPLVLDAIYKLLPEGEKFYPEDMLTDQNERVMVQELIREKLLNLLSDEVPHGTGIEVVRFRENEEKGIIEIDANIYCEKESHKGIIIGKDGAMLKKVGMLAREDIERLLGSKVFLKLWVKVKDDWRNSDFMLKELGYKHMK